MKFNHYLLFQAYLFLSLSVLLNAQGNYDPPHTCYRLNHGRVVQASPSEIGIDNNIVSIEFPTEKDWDHQQVFARIPGISTPYSIKINNFKLGTNPANGAPCEYNITPFLKENLNTLILEPEQPDPESGKNFFESLHGISMVIRSAIHVRDVQITSFIEPEREEALVRIHLFIKSYLVEKGDETGFNLVVTDPEGSSVIDASRILKTHLSFGQETELVIDEILHDPILWSPQTPRLYQLELKQKTGNIKQETILSSFGIRDVMVNDSLMVFNGDTLVLELADETITESILNGSSEGASNAISTSKILPCHLVDRFNQNGMVIIRKKEQYEPFSDHPHFNSPSVVIME